ncbi:MerR family transcriptional regulator [Zongyangia hominis]|uniref:MerR family transcriptional regulator n=1 Tax=Zongyangia hominis TaxID=2763677 RepID=A0A926EDF5_9FIRM|nr:MerR family transcriptional regulator [Zongyangia hominis]MBC8571045.1 MerR family transcriptional regulator [Zongyangia hominis]
MFRIGEFSKMGKTTIKTLRYYDEAGLLKPQSIDPMTGYRFYTTNQLMQLHKIQSLRQCGLSIDEVRMVLSGEQPRFILERRKAEMEAELREVSDQLSRLTFLLQEKQEELLMNYTATIKDLPGCIVYSKKLTVPNFRSNFELIPAIGAKVQEKYPDLKCTVPEYCFIVELDKEYRETDIHLEFCESVDQMKPDFDDIHFKEMEPITVVSVMCKGPYDRIPQAYAFAFQWMEENGYAVGGAPRESYIDGIWNKEKEEDWLTEIQVPILNR